MGNFIAKAFVKIKKRSLLTKCDETLLNHLKYNLYGFRNVLADYLYILEGDYCFSMVELDDVSIDYIDCNFYANGNEDLAVKLFLELAQMTDTQISGSWTTFNERTILHKIVHEEEDIRRANYLLNTYEESGRATPLELAEAVMRGDVKLKKE